MEELKKDTKERWRFRGVKTVDRKLQEPRSCKKLPAPAAARVLKAEGLGTKKYRNVILAAISLRL